MSISSLSPATLAIAGDWHANKRYAVKAIHWAAEQGAEVIIHVGDFGYHFDEDFLDEISIALSQNDMTLAFLDGNHECGTDDMRAVTRNGFKHYYELSVGDEVLSVDDRGKSIWLPVQSIIVKEYDGPVYKLKARGVSGRFTPGHRIVYQDYLTKKWKESAAEDFRMTTSVDLTVSGINDQPDFDIHDDMIRLYAWCLTDSHHRADGGWHFYQNSADSYRIRDILTNLRFKVTESTRQRDITEICGTKLKTKVKPETTIRLNSKQSESLPWDGNTTLNSLVSKLSTRQFDIFIEELIFTDGSQPKNASYNTGVIYSVSNAIKDDLQVLLAYNGYRSSRYEPRPGDDRLNICKRTHTTTSNNGALPTEDYSGKVWCVTVSNGRFFMEHDGSIHLTGNCFPRLYSAWPINSNGYRELRYNLFHLPRGFRWEWHEASYMALGGAHSVDRQWRRENISWWPQESITVADEYRACAGGHVDVMFTHDCPLGVDIPGIDDDSSSWIPEIDLYRAKSHRRVLRGVVDEVTPKELFHGHYHTKYDSVLVGKDYRTEVHGLYMDGGDFEDNITIKELL